MVFSSTVTLKLINQMPVGIYIGSAVNRTRNFPRYFMQPPFPGIVLYFVTRNIPKSSDVLLMSGELVLSVDCYVCSYLIYTVFLTRSTFFETQK